MEPSLATPTICEELWLDGGNLVIRAENTLFKVLAAHIAIASSVFGDMLGVPQPLASGLETHDGLPFVLLPDAAFDVGDPHPNLFARVSSTGGTLA
jgi:hypothetical protein